MSEYIEADDWSRERASLRLPSEALGSGMEISLTLKPRGWPLGHRPPRATLTLGGRAPVTHWLEPRRRHQRLAQRLPADLETRETLRLTLEGAHLAEAPRLRLHRQPGVDGPFLILAPHPDDAELAAGGFYTDHAASVHIVTLSCGEKLKGLERQYLSGLDQDLDEAIQRKAEWRRWNAHATPLLSGIPPERSVMIGMPDGEGWSLIHDGIGKKPVVPLDQARGLNQIELPHGDAETLERDHVLAALRRLIDTLKPGTVLVTDPEFDPHADHRATSLALALALAESRHRPANVMLYANHYRQAYPPGPAFQPAWMPPTEIAIDSLFGEAPIPLLWPLSVEMQKHKALLLDSMSDLSPRANRRQQRRRARRAGFVPTFAAERDSYFQAAIRSTEFFRVLSGDAFVEGWLRRGDTARL
jgi:LmbE family N-acetylglucosaminyl deacetylase